MKHKKKATTIGRIAFRTYPEQERLFQAALNVHPQAWRGISFFAREALVVWASATVAAARPAAKVQLRKGKKAA